MLSDVYRWLVHTGMFSEYATVCVVKLIGHGQYIVVSGLTEVMVFIWIIMCESERSNVWNLEKYFPFANYSDKANRRILLGVSLIGRSLYQIGWKHGTWNLEKYFSSHEYFWNKTQTVSDQKNTSWGFMGYKTKNTGKITHTLIHKQIKCIHIHMSK